MYERTSDAPSSRKTRLNHGPMFGTRRMRAGGKLIAASAATVLFFDAAMETLPSAPLTKLSLPYQGPCSIPALSISLRTLFVQIDLV